MLNGFEIYNMSSGLASVSVGENGVAFSKSAVIKMGKCKYVQLLIDKNQKRIAIKKANENDEGAIQFYNNQKIVSVRWNNKELLKTIAMMMDWELKGKVYKANGNYIAEDEAMIFELLDAECIPSK